MGVGPRLRPPPPRTCPVGTFRATFLAILLILTAASLSSGIQRLGLSPYLTPTASFLRRYTSSLVTTGGRGGTPASHRPGAPPPFRATLQNHLLNVGREKGDLHSPWFEFGIFKEFEGAYPVHVVADCFIVCHPTPAIIVMSRHYQRTPTLDHTLIRVAVQGGPPKAGSWHFERSYETIAIGTFPLEDSSACSSSSSSGGGGNIPLPLPSLPITLTYRDTAVHWVISKAPEPPPSEFAMVAVFSFSRYLLPLWLSYWHALGVDTFYLFYNGDSENPTNVTRVLEELEGFRGSVVVMDWSVMHWIETDGSDITCGQPIAINSAVIRWRHLHKFMAFYDTDEFLVTPKHTNLHHLVQAWSSRVGPIFALRTTCSWGMLNLTTTTRHASITTLQLEHLVDTPVVRGPPAGREKYILNCSAVDAWGVQHVNLHGVYSHQVTGGGGAVGEPDLLLPAEGEFTAYHLHLLNTVDNMRKMDSREVFMPSPGKEIRDTELGDLVRRAIVAKAESRGSKVKVY